MVPLLAAAGRPAALDSLLFRARAARRPFAVRGGNRASCNDLDKERSRMTSEAMRAGDSGAVSAFLRHHYRHFNAASLIDAAEGYIRHLDEGGQMLVTLA